MRTLRHSAIRLALDVIARSGVGRLAAPLARGRGVILTLHRVTDAPPARAPENAGLAITPGFLDRVLLRLLALGYDLIPLDEVPAGLLRLHQSR